MYIYLFVYMYTYATVEFTEQIHFNFRNMATVARATLEYRDKSVCISV